MSSRLNTQQRFRHGAVDIESDLAIAMPGVRIAPFPAEHAPGSLSRTTTFFLGRG